jgi:hypothetical protein
MKLENLSIGKTAKQQVGLVPGSLYIYLKKGVQFPTGGQGSDDNQNSPTKNSSYNLT